MKINPVTPSEKYPALAEAMHIHEIFFKREDLHPYGSHKGRSIPFMIDHYANQGKKDFVISSSGNAALAAAMHISKKHSDLSLDIFVGQNINPKKLERLKQFANENIRVLIKERPLQALIQAVNEGKQSLRQSNDDIALDGYTDLAKEIADQFPSGSIFIGTSSGTTAQALSEYFIKEKLPFQVHVVQTSSCHPIADAFETFDIPDEKSIADAIVDHTAYRKSKVANIVGKTGGRAWCATNEHINMAVTLVKRHTGLQISPNSALSVAGAMQAAYTGYELIPPVICLICGE